MRICAAQTRPFAGQILKNIEAHKGLIELAISNRADLIIFPELSITGYEPRLAKNLATNPDDSRFDEFQKLSDDNKIVIGIGMPIVASRGVKIEMIFFQPHKSRTVYSKQRLHSDELPYFIEGNNEVLLKLQSHSIAPAICYESLLPEHSEKAVQSGANIYFASVAKSARGVDKAMKHFSETAKKYSIPILMSNSVGPIDDFVGFGWSSVWDETGDLVAQLDETSEGLITFDSKTKEIIKAECVTSG